MPEFDVIVVGAGGAMGSAACFELARRGARVLGLDQFGIAHDRGSSHGRSRLIRLAYYEHPDYVPLLKRAYENWRKLESISGKKILEITGGIYAGPRGCSLVENSRRASELHKLDHELLDRRQIAQRFGQLNLPAGYVGFFEPQGGFVRPELAIETFAHHAMLAGAQFHDHEPLSDWRESSAGTITVVTDRATYECSKLILCGGAWTSKIIRDLGIELTVTRQTMGWVRTDDPRPFALGKFPCWAVQQANGSLYYGFPMQCDEPGLKIAHHKLGPVADADSLSREPTDADADTLRAIVEDVIPAARGPIAAMQICMYTNSPDSYFIVGEHPRCANAIIACGFSGHGFKFASVIGEALADLATRAKTELPTGFLSPARFQKTC